MGKIYVRKQLVPYLVLLLIIPIQAISQKKTDTIYFNGNWDKTTRDSAVYFRIWVKDSLRYKVTDYYMNGKIQMAGFLTSLQPEVKEGNFKYYAENGQLTDEENYKNGKREGLSKSFGDDGRLLEEGYYKNDEQDSLWKHYDSLGHIWFTENYKNGNLNGTLNSFYRDGKLKRKELYKDGLVLEGTCYAESGEELKYTPFRQKPQFKGDIIQYLSKKIKYPKKERKAGISGTVYVTFIVEKDGSVSAIKVLRGVPNGPGLEQEAVRVISSMPKWKPGTQDDRTVRVHYRIPIHFKLN